MKVKSLIKQNKFSYAMAIWLLKKFSKSREALTSILPERTRRFSYMGRPFVAPSRSTIGQSMERGVVWDQEPIELLARLLPSTEKLTIIEIGNNVGASAVTLARYFPKSEFLFIEGPNRFYGYLEKNISACIDKFRIIDIQNKIVGRKSNEPIVLTTNGTTGTPSSAKYGSNETSKRIDFATPLDEIALGLRLTRIDLLKINTDRYEKEVWASGKTVLKKFKPTLFIEFFPNALERVSPADDLIDLLLGCGYQADHAFGSDGSYIGKIKISNKLISEVRNSKFDYWDLIALPG